VVSALWPRIAEIVAGAHGPICPRCIASALALSGAFVSMATLGLARRNDFETGEETCGSCGVRARAVRVRRVRGVDSLVCWPRLSRSCRTL